MTIKLHVGAGGSRQAPTDGWINTDLYPSPGLDCVFSLLEPWPFAAQCADVVYASHVLEHLSDPANFFREAWRVLIPEGSCILRVPYGAHRSAWWDPTHLRPWFAESFAHLQPGFGASIGNPQHGESTPPWEVESVQMRFAPRWAYRLRHRMVRKLMLPWIDALQDVVEELFVTLRPLKTSVQLQAWRASGRHPAVVPCVYVGYQHDILGQPYKQGDSLSLIRMGIGEACPTYR